MSIFHRLDSDEISLEIDIDQGARISSLNYRGYELTVPFRGELLTWGWYAMGPWAGRVKNGLIYDSKGVAYQLPTNLAPPHAIHGFTLTSTWQELGPGYFGIDFPSPYQGARMEQRFELLDNALRWSIEYETGDTDLPFWIGLHPWFPREIGVGESAEIEFSAARMYERDSNQIPTGELIEPTGGPWDDAFTEISGSPTIYWQDALSVEIVSDTPYWVVYNQDSEGICIEPQTAPPDAQNLGIVGESYLEALFIFNEI